MKKRSLSCKFVVSILLFSLILIPVTSSISFAQDESPAAGGAATGGAAGLSRAAVLGMAAAAVAMLPSSEQPVSLSTGLVSANGFDICVCVSLILT